MEALSQIAQSPEQLNALVHNKALHSKEKLKEISVQFESIMLRNYLNTAMKPLLEGQMGKGPAGNHFYQGMIVDQMADSLARTGQMGIGEVFYEQLKDFVPEEEGDAKAELQDILKRQSADKEAEPEIVETDEDSPEEAEQIQHLYQMWADKGVL